MSNDFRADEVLWNHGKKHEIFNPKLRKSLNCDCPPVLRKKIRRSGDVMINAELSKTSERGKSDNYTYRDRALRFMLGEVYVLQWTSKG